jgi:hypothetical protein
MKCAVYFSLFWCIDLITGVAHRGRELLAREISNTFCVFSCAHAIRILLMGNVYYIDEHHAFVIYHYMLYTLIHRYILH